MDRRDLLAWSVCWVLALGASHALGATDSLAAQVPSSASMPASEDDDAMAEDADDRGVNQAAVTASASTPTADEAKRAQRQELRRAVRDVEASEQKKGPEHPATGRHLTKLAQLYALHGRYAEALPLFERALAITEKAKGSEHPDVARRLKNVGWAHQAMGQYTNALPLFERALSISEIAHGPEHPDTGKRLDDLGKLHQDMGRLGKALPLLETALAISEKANGAEHPETGARLDNLARLYADLGQYAKALPLCARALAISERANGPQHPDTAKRLSLLGQVYRQLGQTTQALPLYERALAISEKVNGRKHPDTAKRLNDLAQLYRQLGRDAQALPLYKRALAISEEANGPDHPDTGKRLNNLARLYQSMGKTARAQLLYERALAISESADAPELAWKVLGNLMRVHSKRKLKDALSRQPALAIWYGKRAVNTLQAARLDLSVLGQDFQDSFLKQYQGTYQTLADLLIQAGRIAEAEQVLAMLKEGELAELTRNSEVKTTRMDDTRTAERQASAEQRRLTAEGVKDAAMLVELNRSAASLSPADERRRQDLLRLAQSRREALQRFYTGLARDFAKEGQRGQARQAATEVTRLQGIVALDQDVAIGLHYVMTDERVAIIVATPGGSFGRFSDIKRAELNHLISTLRTAITARADTLAPAQALWRALIEPVHADLLAAGAKTIVLSPSDSLRYLPFAALQDPGGRYLVQDYALSLWAAAVDMKPSANKVDWRVAGLGLTQPKPGFAGLPSVATELRGIVRTSANPEGMLAGSIQLDEQFGRAQFEAALRGDANVIHVASHFDFKPGDESRSVLLLGKGNETLSLGELAVLDFSKVDLLTFSACETAVGGGENENGAEVEGLAAVVLNARGQAVLATLWKVADASTAELMRAFYAQRLQSGTALTRARALQQAQLTLLNGASAGDAAASAASAASDTARGATAVGRSDKPMRVPVTANPSRPWAHPYYWAPFVLSGNWM